MNRQRPKHLNLFRIHQPMTAVASIGHRLSGVLLVLLTPVLIYVLQLSLHDARGFAEVLGWLGSLPVKLVGLVAVWALVHHFLAGIRHLLQDLGCGTDLAGARRGAWFVSLLALGLTLVVGLGVML